MNKLIHIFLVAGVLATLALLYFILAPDGKLTLSLLQWSLLGGLAVALGLGAFLPSLLRRQQGLPQESLSPSDLRFALAVAAVLCPLAFLAVWAFGPFGSFVIMLAPIAFILQCGQRPEQGGNRRRHRVSRQAYAGRHLERAFG
jgi:hypothetical protein